MIVTPPPCQFRISIYEASSFPQTVPAISDGGIHVWSIPVDLSRPIGVEASRILSNAETDYAASCGRSTRHTFVVCRVWLRRLLGLYLESEPTALQIVRSRSGKPSLCRFAHCERLDFNVSHSGNRGVIAIGNSASLGVDIEKTRTMSDVFSVARRNLSSDEWAVFEKLRDRDRVGGFLRYWTRKEAVVKCQGTGLWREPREISVPPEAHEYSSFNPVLYCENVVWVRDLPLSAGYVGAIALGSTD